MSTGSSSRSVRRQQRSRDDLVTRRPQVGRAYEGQSESTTVTSSRATPRPQATTPSPEPWCCCSVRCFQNCLMCRGEEEEDMGVPGGRNLWVRMISWLVVVEVLGCICLFLGTTFLTNSVINSSAEDGNKSSVAISACLLVAGAILMGGGLLLGRLFISNKWRKTTEGSEELGRRNERRRTRGRHQSTSNDTAAPHISSDTHNETSFVLMPPLLSLPSYEQVLADNSNPSDFTISPSATEPRTSGAPTPSVPGPSAQRPPAPRGREDPCPPYTVTAPYTMIGPDSNGSDEYGPPSSPPPEELEPPPPYVES